MGLLALKGRVYITRVYITREGKGPYLKREDFFFAS